MGENNLEKAVCTHVPSEPFHHVGQVVSCKLCGVDLIYSNSPPGSKHRMSKKERRKLKAQQRMVEETNVKR